MLILKIVYISFSILATGFGLSLTLFRKNSPSFSCSFLLGFAVVVYSGFLFLVFGIFHYFTILLHLLTLVSTIVLCLALQKRGLRPLCADEIRAGRAFAFVALVAIAFYVRLPPSNFIFHIGDAGAYINSANHLVRQGTITTQFFPLTQVWLGIFSGLAGKANAPYAIPYTSVLATIFFYLLVQKLFACSKTAFLAFFIIAINILAIWFGRLSYSESLMLFLNITILYLYASFENETDVSLKPLYLILIPLYVGLASLNRVTGIVWMFILTCNVMYHLFYVRRNLLYHFIIFNVSMLFYLLSVYYGLEYSRNYYINWQLSNYIPFLTNVRRVIYFHLGWVFLINIFFFVIERFKPDFLFHRLEKINHFINHFSVLVSIISFFGLLFIGNLILNGNISSLFAVAFVQRLLEGKMPIDVYYLYNYFSVGALMAFPVGLFYLFRNHNILKRPSLSVFWLFSFSFLLIYYSRSIHTYIKSHDVYLYWDRYFLSEVFIVFLLVITAFIHMTLQKGKIVKSICLVFIVCYTLQSGYWFSKNYNMKYLRNAYQTLASIESRVPRKNSVVFIDVHYPGKWLFHNFRRCFLLPLQQSFGYAIHYNKNPLSPFEPDAPLNKRKVLAILERGKTVYVLLISKWGNIPLDIEDLPGVAVNYIDTIRSFIEVKAHDPTKIFQIESKKYYFTIDIVALEKISFETETANICE